MKQWLENIKWKEWIKSFLIAVFIILFFRNFILRVYVVESDSMENTVKHGDFVYVNLLAYGARFPMTPVGIPFTDIYSSSLSLGYARVPGYASPAHNEVVMFNDPSQYQVPVDRRTTMMKRIIALPGDTLLVRNDSIYVNGKFLQDMPSVSHDYVLTLSNNVSPQQVIDKFELSKLHPLVGNDHIASLTHEKYLAVKKSKEVVNVVRWEAMDKENLDFGFALDGGNRNNFGPVVIPKPGMKIPLALNFAYGNTIRHHEGVKLRMAAGRILLEEKNDGTYTFTQDYYFVLGDNRDNSVDSRNFGFVPRSHLIGRAGFVVFSYDKTGNGGVRWSRIFNAVN